MRFRFADCELDTDAHVLQRLGQPVHVEPQVFDLIVMLLEASGDLVGYEALVEEVWAGRAISDATLAARVSAARTALGDDGRRQAIIRTVARRGLQMAVPVVQAANRPDARAKVSLPKEGDRSGAAASQAIRYVGSADGVSIAYAQSGSGPPLLRVGHWLTHLELDWHSPIWRPFLERLGRHHTLFRYDQRGTGLSDRTIAGEGIDAFVADLAAVADATGADRLPIIAASQGVAVALKFAALYPQRVDRLVLYAGFAKGRYRRDDPAARDEARAHLALVQSGWSRPESPFLKLFTQLYLPSGTREQIEHLIQMQLASASAAGAARLRDIVDDFDVSDLLEKVEAPVLLLHGREDAVQPIEQSRLMARRLPNAVLVPLDTDSHLPLPQSPAWQVLMDEIERFLGDAG